MKYALGQVVYYMRDDLIHSAEILSRMTVENAKESSAHTHEQRDLFTPYGPSRTIYATCHGQYPEDRVFGSKTDLIDDLLQRER